MRADHTCFETVPVLIWALKGHFPVVSLTCQSIIHLLASLHHLKGVEFSCSPLVLSNTSPSSRSPSQHLLIKPALLPSVTIPFCLFPRKLLKKKKKNTHQKQAHDYCRSHLCSSSIYQLWSRGVPHHPKRSHI